MYVAKLNDLYLKNYDLTWTGILRQVKLTTDATSVKIFKNINWNPKTMESFKNHGFKFYKLSETEVNE